MKIAIIYSTSSGITKKAAKILSNKIKAKIQLIPIEKAKTACLLKYDFIILAGSLYHGKVQGTLKRYISRNMGTLMEKPVALFMNCDEKSNTKSHLNKTFSEHTLNRLRFLPKISAFTMPLICMTSANMLPVKSSTLL